MYDFVFVCQSNAIRRILATLNSSIYTKIRNESFENSSIWEVKITFPYRNAAANPVKKSQIVINSISKIYPIGVEHEPLIKKGNKYVYNFKQTYMPLFENIKELSPNLLTLIKKSSNNNNKKNNKNEEENTNIITKHRTTTTKKNNIYYKNKNFLSLIESVIS